MSLIAVILGLAVLAVAAVFALRAAKPDAAKTAKAAATAHAAGAAQAPAATQADPMGRMLQCGDTACAVARESSMTWFREADVPKLPLAGCSQAEQCKCRFLRVAERRKEHRRAAPDRRGALRFGDAADRRTGKDRRKDRDTWRGHF
ncbi:MAG: hypothetical protein NVS9B10_27810 [Nevskia sp.]